MASSNPPRKFAPTPIEQTTKSSRQPSPPREEKAKPRRFAPEPVEETAKSSKDRKPQPANAEEQPKTKVRRFAPEPVEHTTKSSKDVQQKPAENEKPKPRRFAPQLVDATESSSKGKVEPEKSRHIRFKPEVIATTYGSNRKPKSSRASSTATSEDGDAEKKPPRKFTPILIDTASRSRRAGDPNAPLEQNYRTEYGYHAHAHEHWRRVTGQRTPSVRSEASTDDMDDEVEEASQLSPVLKRQVSPLDGSAPSRRGCLIPARQHSFRMPDLDTIESSESEPDSTPESPSSSPLQGGSPLTTSDSSYELFKHATRRRESIDESFTHYLLDIERKKAQQRLEEQALAAFPNADFGYEPPRHYFADEDDDDEMEIDERPVTWEGHDEDMVEMRRRESTALLSWEQQYLQRHAEAAQQEQNANKVTAKQTGKSPFTKPGFETAEDTADEELKSMRERARPPMLGGDIVFPRSTSPQPARFDVTQGSTALRAQMCYLTEAAEAERKRTGEEGGLWAAPQADKKKRVSTIKSPVANKKTSVAKGLWGGFCADDGGAAAKKYGLAPPPGPTGLETPRPESPNPFEQASADGRPVGLMTPQTPTKNTKKADLGRLNAILVTEREIDAMMEREYPDSFITQVYNYLSLGYASLARPFDDELSKISRIPIPELRQDDEKARANPKGYIRLGSDFEGGGGEGTSEDDCMRWQALKRYVREWAKQEKNMVKSDVVGGMWTGARRGSWAI